LAVSAQKHTALGSNQPEQECRGACSGGASHVSWNPLQRSLHYSDLNDLRALTAKAKALMMRMFQDRI
jgi:hypothetical protein